MNGYGSGDRKFEGIGSVSWVKICKIMFLAGDGHFLVNCSDFVIECIV